MTIRAAGPAPAATAWERYAVPADWPTWAPQIKQVDCAADRIAPGVTGRVVGHFGVAVGFRVDAVDEAARTWSWQVRVGPIRLRLGHDVTARDRGCATRLRLSGPLPVVAAYAPIARLALRQLVR